MYKSLVPTPNTPVPPSPQPKGPKVLIAHCRTSPCTSSTAQGRDGSSKNMKPRGEIGCCESRMADQKH